MKLSVAAFFSLASMASLVLGAPAADVSSRLAVVERADTTCPGCTSSADSVDERDLVVDPIVERDSTTCPGCFKSDLGVEPVVERTPVVEVAPRAEVETCHGCGVTGPF